MAVHIVLNEKPLFCHVRLALFGSFLWLFLLLSFDTQAQLLPSAAAEKDTAEVMEPKWPEDPLGRRTPRGTVSGFIKAVADQNYEKAAFYLNIEPALQESQEGAELARVLQGLLDKDGNIFPYSLISDDTAGEVEDELRPSFDQVGTLMIQEETVEVLVEEIKGPEGGPIWLFSSETIEKIAALQGVMAAPLVDRLLPEILEEYQWGGVAAGQWLIMVVLAVLAYLLAWLITAAFLFLLRRFWHTAATEPLSGILQAFVLPVRLYLAVWIFVASTQEAGISIILRQRFSGITLIIGLAALLLLLWRLTDFITSFSEKRMSIRGHLAGVSAVLFLRRAAKVAIIVFGVIVVLGAFGVDVTTGLAALGIGGIALALGAQKTVENFVGSVTLIADQPIRVGDFCKAGDTIGTVEQIGMRSTRIRTLDRTIVTIPNGEFSSAKIENYAHRDRFKFAPVFNLRYETTPDQMRYLLVELRAILYAHPKVDPVPARVRFAELAAASLNVEIFAYILTKDFNEFVEIREDLLLRMIDVVEASGTGFAFPSQTLYIARDAGLSEEKSRAAEEKVRKWKEAGEMQIPSFDPEKIDELKDTIAYPPKGSAQQDSTKP
ncbi:mechanosensitive ion channel family protein [Nafulsella turpanensis]|uniref:mechanosensitive ion channel family protein n=1 Tax=Nafulsella turpanensis TaxID=1265690 RepID=UPI00034D090B|nr:mechanosensitive ion channel family protein [Nafulsella turpanensis]